MRGIFFLSVILAFFGGCVSVNFPAQRPSDSSFTAFEFEPGNPLIEKRIIFINGCIDPAMAQNVTQALAYLNEKSTTEPIKILINSSGGDGTAYMTMANMIKSVDAPVDTVNFSLCGSAAAMLFLNATGRRYAMQDSAFMIHDGSGKPKELLEMYSKHQDELLQSKCQLPPEWFPLKKKEIVISAEDAKKYKMIDEIITKVDLQLHDAD